MMLERLSAYCTDEQWQALLASYPELNGKLPPMLYEGLHQYGLEEVPGPGSNPVINAMFDAVAQATGEASLAEKSDDDPWCSLYLAFTALQAHQQLPVHCLWAFGWLRLPGGTPVPISQARMGDLAIYGRDEWDKTLGHGHIVVRLEQYASGWGFIHGLGGNQTNGVNVQPKNMKNLVGVIRPNVREAT